MRTLLLVTALACATPAWGATEWVRGEVVRLDPARSRITIKHAPIKLVKMAAMTMPFKVRDAALLEPLKIGDRVRFQVMEHESELIVQAIEAQR